MALRDQPYFPLYVDDYLTDEKLNMCAPASQGIYIKILCIMHKSENYGCILLKQKDKQDENVCLNFARKLARLLPFTIDEINDAIIDLLDEKVLYLDDGMLCQKRMIKDNSISVSRSKAGSKGGTSTQQKNKNFDKAKTEANSVNVNEYVNEDVIEINKESDFDIFWKAYDYNVGLRQAQDEWLKIKREMPNEIAKILVHVPLYVASKPDKSYRKKPENYLKDRTWKDEIVPTKELNSPKAFDREAYEESERRRTRVAL
jgi:uncharacterized protein YdaU (DUF1376 family)